MNTRLRAVLALIALTLAATLPGVFALPPLDRDESRFAQATTQMIESGDFVRIRVQAEARNKKPVGIHWLQAAAVSVFSDADDRAIWAYRLPSLVGAVITVLAAYWAGCILFGRRAAFAGAALLATSLILGAEAGIAKTDAMLAAATTLTLAALARMYEGGGRWSGALFWTALGLGVLLKGPITPMVAGLAIIVLVVIDRRARWLRPLAWWPGPLIAIAIVAPWLIAVQNATDGAFLREALGGDLGPKLVSGHESHGAPPGTHLALLPLLAWPVTLFLIPGIAGAVRALFQPFDDHEAGAFRFLLAWTVPAWLVFELMPTKLAHYTLPLYPALALMAGAAFNALAERRVVISGYLVSIAVFAGLGAALAAALFVLPPLADAIVAQGRAPDLDMALAVAQSLTQPQRIIILGVAGGLLLAPLMLWRAPSVTLALACATAVVGHWWLFQMVTPRLAPLFLADTVSAQLEAQALHPRLSARAKPPLVALGFREPSLVFLTRTDTVLAETADGGEIRRLAEAYRESVSGYLSLVRAGADLDSGAVTDAERAMRAAETAMTGGQTRCAGEAADAYRRAVDHYLLALRLSPSFGLVEGGDADALEAAEIAMREAEDGLEHALAEGVDMAAAVFTAEAGRAAIVESCYIGPFLEAVAERGAPEPIPAGEDIIGFNYSNGEAVQLTIFRSMGRGREREARLRLDAPAARAP